MKRKEVGGLPGNVLGMLADLMLKLQHGARTPRQLEKFLKGKNPFVEGDYSDIIAEWQTLYKKLFGIDCDFSGLRIPKKPKDGKRRLLVIVDLLLETLYVKCQKLFPCRRWMDKNFDEIVIKNERIANGGPYAIWVRDKVEADEEFKSFSANDIKDKGITTETLAERFIHELKVFDEAGKHLDIVNISLCAGSRCNGDNVPSVYWYNDEMHVNWYSPGFARSNLRARGVVS